MANWNRWSVAAGLAGALAVFGPAWAQTPGTSSNMGTSQQGTTDTSTGKENGTRSGWTGSSATEPGERAGEAATGSQGSRDTTTGSAQGTASSSDTAAAPSTASSAKVDKKLQDDLQKLHADNQAEVQMGQMGAQQAQSPEVKQFAEQMQTDHQKADQKLTEQAVMLSHTPVLAPVGRLPLQHDREPIVRLDVASEIDLPGEDVGEVLDETTLATLSPICTFCELSRIAW